MAESAEATIRETLRSFGLPDSLASTIWSQWFVHEGRPLEQIFIDIRNTPEYKQRFPAMEQLAASGRAITEDQYIKLESQYSSIMRSAGLPQGFYDDPADFGRFIGNEVSPRELEQRVFDGIVAAQQAPQEVKTQLQQLYGVGPGELTAFYLDPDKALPVIQRQFAAAQISGAGVRTGYGALTQTEAERLAALGITAQEAEKGLGGLAAGRELMQALPGEAGYQISRERQLGAITGDIAAQQELERAAARRKSRFAEGGEFAATQKGITGLGTAAT